MEAESLLKNCHLFKNAETDVQNAHCISVLPGAIETHKYDIKMSIAYCIPVLPGAIETQTHNIQYTISYMDKWNPVTLHGKPYMANWQTGKLHMAN